MTQTALMTPSCLWLVLLWLLNQLAPCRCHTCWTCTCTCRGPYCLRLSSHFIRQLQQQLPCQMMFQCSAPYHRWVVFQIAQLHSNTHLWPSLLVVGSIVPIKDICNQDHDRLSKQRNNRLGLCPTCLADEMIRLCSNTASAYKLLRPIHKSLPSIARWPCHED